MRDFLLSNDFKFLVFFVLFSFAVVFIPRPSRKQDLPKLDAGWFRSNYFIPLACIFAIVAIFAFVFYLRDIALIVRELVATLLKLSSQEPSVSIGQTVRNLGQTIALLLAALAAAATLVFQLIRVWVIERQTVTAERGHMTDRVNKAVENLGADKSVQRIGRNFAYQVGDQKSVEFEWENDRADPLVDLVGDKQAITPTDWQTFTLSRPNIEVRLGGLYALERIARDSPDDHLWVMEILCAYIRENSPVTRIEDNPYRVFWSLVHPDNGVVARSRNQGLTENQAWDDPRFRKVRVYGAKPEDMNITNAKEWAKTRPLPRIDIQTAITIIGRRTTARKALERDSQGKPTYRLDLRGVTLRRADLTGLDLEHAILKNSHLEAADLSGAKLYGADFSDAGMDAVDLRKAELSGADFEGAWLIGTQISIDSVPKNINLRSAKLDGTFLAGQKLDGFDLEKSSLCRVDLSTASLNNANLKESRFKWSQFGAAELKGADLRKARLEGTDLQGTHLEGALLEEAKMHAADFCDTHIDEETSIELADLRGAGIRGLDLRSRKDMSLTDTFGDASVQLPRGLEAGIGILSHWSSEKLDLDEFYTSWETWLKERHPDLLDTFYRIPTNPLGRRK